MAHEFLESPKPHYPLDPNCYKIVAEIGVGVSAVVYKAECLPLNSAVVAIKSIDLDKSKADFDAIRCEAKTMSLLSHPNILNAHCSFAVGRCLWVVMPFMSAGSLQSIIASVFPDGLPEQCIAAVLKETLSALQYLHKQGHLHRDIKAGNILVDTNGAVKLADFGVSASVYETAPPFNSSSALMLTDVTGTPYWMAPEVIHSHTGYSFKADIWSFGITALELAHGRPPLSHLPPSKSLVMKITKRFKFIDQYDKKEQDKCRKFSKSFKDMVGQCLDQDPSRRPTAEKLLKHPFFKNTKGAEFLIRNLLFGLPSIEQRFRGSRKSEEEEEDGGDGAVKERRISGWNFNEEGFEMAPVLIPRDNMEMAIQEETKGVNEGNGEEVGGFDTEKMLEGLNAFHRSLDLQRKEVMQLIALLGGDVGREEMDKLKMELEMERRRNFELEMEMEFLKLHINN